MSINEAQRRRTAEEFAALCSQIPVEEAALAERLGLTPEEFANVVQMRCPDPREVWRVRDFLVAVARAHGIEAPEFTVLVESKRTSAHHWFGSWDVPSVKGL